MEERVGNRSRSRSRSNSGRAASAATPSSSSTDLPSSGHANTRHTSVPLPNGDDIRMFSPRSSSPTPLGRGDTSSSTGTGTGNNECKNSSSETNHSNNNSPVVLVGELKEALSGRYFRITPRICAAIRCGVPSELRRSLWNGLSNAVNGGRRRTTVSEGASTKGWRRGWKRGHGKSSRTNQYIVRSILKHVNGNAMRGNF